MFAAVEKLYRDGEKHHPQWPPLVGQLMSSEAQGRRRLEVWPLTWVANVGRRYPPLAILWEPALVGIDHATILVRGLECFRRGEVKRWYAQVWRCEILDAHELRG